MSNRLLLLASFLFIAGSRLYYVESFAVSLPFWDQWDAEGAYLLKPWMEGTLKFSDLWQPHNEHRIFPTRLLSLLIFQFTGTWNNLTEARLNILLAAGIPMMLMAFLCWKKELFGLRWLLLFVIIAQFSLPFSFENFLIGFQSQFYFVVIFTLFSLVLATLYPVNPFAVAAILMASILSVMTMASGLLTPLAVAGIYLLHGFVRKRPGYWMLMVVISLLAVSLGGYFWLPQNAVSRIYQVQDLTEFLEASGYILSWPVTGSKWMGAVLWLPAFLIILSMVLRKMLTQTDLLMAGCFMWSLAQGLAIAFGRGHDLTLVSSRYAELFSLGLIASAWFVVRFIELMPKYALRWVALSFFIILAHAHVIRHSADMRHMRSNYALSCLQIKHVRLYLQTGDKSVLDQPEFHIPYPDAVRLQELLDNPTIRKILVDLNPDDF